MGDTEEGGQVKRKFDKKKWRELKYSKGARVKQWEENRKKVMKHKLNKQLRKEGALHKGPTKDVPNRQFIPQRNTNNPLTTYEEKKKERERQKEENLRKQKEKEAALLRYKKNKMEKIKKLSKRNKKGQPLMNARVELLYQQIQKSMTNS